MKAMKKPERRSSVLAVPAQGGLMGRYDGKNELFRSTDGGTKIMKKPCATHSRTPCYSEAGPNPVALPLPSKCAGLTVRLVICRARRASQLPGLMPTGDNSKPTLQPEHGGSIAAGANVMKKPERRASVLPGGLNAANPGFMPTGDISKLVSKLELLAEVRKTPSWPRIWANFSLF